MPRDGLARYVYLELAFAQAMAPGVLKLGTVDVGRQVLRNLFQCHLPDVQSLRFRLYLDQRRRQWVLLLRLKRLIGVAGSGWACPVLFLEGLGFYFMQRGQEPADRVARPFLDG